ncbi:MAG: HEAT repeat domain-containing protein [Treponema sp.]|jgi:HEAT repeat protein|nr:HEAT repeat domain-containing protein [Treponema sp.]
MEIADYTYYIEELGAVTGIAGIPWIVITSVIAFAFAVFFVSWYIRVTQFKSHLRKISAAENEMQKIQVIKDFNQRYPEERLQWYSLFMESYLRHAETSVVSETGFANKWINKLTQSPSPSPRDLRRVLLFCPSSFLFKAFVVTGRHSRLQNVFIRWMKSEGEEKIIRLLADNFRGEDFDPGFCRIFLENHSAFIRELTGEQEWNARYFAYKILLLDKGQLTERNFLDGLSDPNTLIRKIITESFTLDPDRTWKELWEKLIKDPVYEVRAIARKRISKDFMDRYNPKAANLNDDQTARVLELLDVDCQEDRNFAFTSLGSNDLALRFHAAAFLDACGALNVILSKITFVDPVSMKHSVSLLQKALSVNVSGFLSDYPAGDGAPLLAAARLLGSSSGMYTEVCTLAKKVFAYTAGKKLDPSSIEIYTETLKAINNNGSSKVFELLAEELSRRENSPQYLDILLPHIGKNTQMLFAPILFKFLVNPAFPKREELVSLLGSFPPGGILPAVFQILNDTRADYPHLVRISALKILGLLHLPFCLQRILESLPALFKKAEIENESTKNKNVNASLISALAEIESFARLIADFPLEILEAKIRSLLASPDAQIRAALITILPITKNEGFIKEIRASLKDVDPDVRIAAINALLRFGEMRLLNQETSMLRDPVERVRVATAEVIARYGNASAMEILKNILIEPSETESVKIGVLAGLGKAESSESIRILISVLDSQSEFCVYAEKSLGTRTNKRDIQQLVEIFRDSEPALREKMIPVFRVQGSKAEPQILELLKNEIASFKPYLVKVLEETGFVDEAKRRLLSRNVEVRREAALTLSLMDTLPAFRGLVLAAKDPDQEVRVCVVKALEKLKNSQSRETLEELKKDPDSRIRKYTHWALERLDSLRME